MHADDVQEVVTEGGDEAADEGGVEEEGGWLGGMGDEQVEAEHAQLEDGVVVGGAHVGQWQHHQQLRPEFPQTGRMDCLPIQQMHQMLPAGLPLPSRPFQGPCFGSSTIGLCLVMQGISVPQTGYISTVQQQTCQAASCPYAALDKRGCNTWQTAAQVATAICEYSSCGALQCDHSIRGSEWFICCPDPVLSCDELQIESPKPGRPSGTKTSTSEP